MRWQLSNRADQVTRLIADRHYNRQKVGSPQFVPPGRCLVLRIGDPAQAFWVTSWPFAKFVKHEWAGAWVCSAFRNEGAGLSSDLIREAVAITRWQMTQRESWSKDPEPELGMITFVNTEKVKQKRNHGYCYLKAGFERVGKTKSGLLAFQLRLEDMPAPLRPLPQAAKQKVARKPPTRRHQPFEQLALWGQA